MNKEQQKWFWRGLVGGLAVAALGWVALGDPPNSPEAQALIDSVDGDPDWQPNGSSVYPGLRRGKVEIRPGFAWGVEIVRDGMPGAEGALTAREDIRVRRAMNRRLRALGREALAHAAKGD